MTSIFIAKVRIFFYIANGRFKINNSPLYIAMTQTDTTIAMHIYVYNASLHIQKVSSLFVLSRKKY